MYKFLLCEHEGRLEPVKSTRIVAIRSREETREERERTVGDEREDRLHKRKDRVLGASGWLLTTVTRPALLTRFGVVLREWTPRTRTQMILLCRGKIEWE
ncbi:hypothetical protein G9C98_006494 [Cotesia typhae]|uniref:Uncharacterized protein n=1 Tax=Cotesia typhae TaxID=2053667 RepID=A0A8J5REV0_9HYME|nr:hypothetical protein G9C98_006494 [Cotesia typhae]